MNLWKGLIFESVIFLNIFVLLISLLVHELAHGIVAFICGDDTAKRYGRLSLNPFHHLDFWGTLIPILLILFDSSFVIGWAKPVPINYSRLRNGRIGEFFVAIAGVVANLILALISAFLYVKFFPDTEILRYMVTLNVLLAIFNILPVPPLDGSRVVACFVGNDLRREIFNLDRYGFWILLALTRFGVLNLVIVPSFKMITTLLEKVVNY